jgi:phage terminase large subunit GpA-like protein
MTWSPWSNWDAVKAAVRRARGHLVPPPDLSPSQWAEANVKIALGNAVPGPIRFDNAPYQRGMIDAAVEPGVERVTLMAGAQTGKTTVLQCIQAYFVAHAPRSQMVMFPSQGDLQTWLEAKFRPMIDGNPALSGLLAKPRGRDGVNNSRMISYPGGFLMFAWAGSPKTMRGRSAPVISVDEIDGMESTEEGDPVQLLWQRAATFGDQRLLLESSTPTVKDASRIETAFQQGDGRQFWVACPHCDQHQVLTWSNVTWQGKDDPNGEQLPESAVYGCRHCGGVWDDGHRIAAIRNAESKGGGWRAQRPFRGHASFHISELYSTFRRLRDIVRSYLDKVAVGDLQSFVNVSLAETYAEQGEQVDPTGLMGRVETYPAQVPEGGLILTAGVDMQADRLEVETIAWGVGEESWSVDFHVLWGDPIQGDVWEDLDEYLAQPFQHASGHTLRIAGACLDTGGTGGATQAAYEYLRARQGRRVIFGVKGVPGWGRPIVSAPKKSQAGKNPRKVDLFLVGVDEAKLLVTRRLAIAKPGPGYCHFPDDRTPEYFEGLAAERLLSRQRKGFTVREWHKVRERNEPFDCRVYATAAFKVLNPSLRRAAERLAAEPGKAAAPAARKENPQVAAPTPAPEHRPVKRSAALGGGRRKSTWANTW